MKKIIIFILAVMLTATALPALAFAEAQDPNEVITVEEIQVTTEETEEAPGILPDSPFYGLKLFIERVQILFTLNPEVKAEKLIEIAQRRLAEMEALSEELQVKLAERLTTAFVKAMDEAEALLEESAEPTVTQAVDEGVSQHNSYQTLQRVYEQVPEQAQPAILRAMERSQTGKLRRLEVQEAKEAGENPGPNLNAPGRNKANLEEGLDSKLSEEESEETETPAPNRPTPPRPQIPQALGRNN